MCHSYILIMIMGLFLSPSARAEQSRFGVKCEDKKNECENLAIFFDETAADDYKKKYEKTHPGDKCQVSKGSKPSIEKQAPSKDGNVK